MDQIDYQVLRWQHRIRMVSDKIINNVIIKCLSDSEINAIVCSLFSVVKLFYLILFCLTCHI